MRRLNAVLNYTSPGFDNFLASIDGSEWGIDPQVDTWAVRHEIWFGKKADDKYAVEQGLKVIPV